MYCVVDRVVFTNGVFDTVKVPVITALAAVTKPDVYIFAVAFTLAAVKDPFANTLPWLYMPLELHTIQSLGSGPPVVVYLPRHKMDDVYEFDVYTRNVPPPFCPIPYRSVGP